MKKHANRPKGARPERDACLTMAQLCMSANLRRTERLVTRHYDSYLAGAGVTAVQLPILSTIATLDDATLRLITEQLDLDRSTLSRNLSVLHRLGLVEIGPSSGPKPGSISLTRKGRDRLRRGYELWQRAHRELTTALDEATIQAGSDFLRQLRRCARAADGNRISRNARR